MELPSPSESPAVQEALSIRYVDKIGLAWLSEATQWAIFNNAGKLVGICPSLSENELKDLCDGQNKAWLAALAQELEAREPGPSRTTKALGDLDL